MLSYKDWKSLNENFGRTLGISTPQSLGLLGLMRTEEEDQPKQTNTHVDGELVDPAQKKDEPKKCKHCGKLIGAKHFCGKMKKEDRHHDEDHEELYPDEDMDDDEDHEDHDEDEDMEDMEDDEDMEDMEDDEDMEDGEDMEDMEDMEDGEESENHDEDHDEDGEYEESKSCDVCSENKKDKKNMKCMKCMMKSESTKHKTKKPKKKHKKIKSKNKKFDFSDMLMKKMMSGGMSKEEAATKSEKYSKKDESAWMNDTFGLDPYKKNFDGINE